MYVDAVAGELVAPLNACSGWRVVASTTSSGVSNRRERKCAGIEHARAKSAAWDRVRVGPDRAKRGLVRADFERREFELEIVSERRKCVLSECANP